MTKLEKHIEKYLAKEVERRGGLCIKFTSPGSRGVPDRIVITPAGQIIFVEVKQASGRVSDLQKWQAAEMRKRKCDVRVIWTETEVDEFIQEVFA